MLCSQHDAIFILFFFNNTATTETYTLSLHDALPISSPRLTASRTTITTRRLNIVSGPLPCVCDPTHRGAVRSEEHTSELQSHSDLVCRLLLEKKKKKNQKSNDTTDYQMTDTLQFHLA